MIIQNSQYRERLSIFGNGCWCSEDCL